MNFVVREARAQPILALLIAALLGFVIAAMTSR